VKDYSERLEKLGYASIEDAALDFYIVQRKSSVWIGKVFGVYPTTVLKRLKKYHIPVRGKGGADTISGWQKEQVRRLKAEGCSNLSTANIVGISDTSVYNIVKEAENGKDETNSKVHR
jgi:DNA invertase Pin-like site-specific DNA recombinase